MDMSGNTSLTDAELLEQYNWEFRNTVLPVTVLFGIEIVFGFFGNLLTMYVFFFRYKPCNFRYFVLSLALTDFISCLTTIPAEMVSQLYWYNYPVPPVCRIKAYFNQFTVCSEAACLTIIAVDRYRKVCQPFRWQIKQRIAMYCCIGIFAVAGILAIPTPIFWGVHTTTELYKGRNITVTVCEKAERFKDTKYPLANIAFNQSLVAVGLAIMLILYVLVTRKLILSHQELKRHRHRSTNTTTIETNTELNSCEIMGGKQIAAISGSGSDTCSSNDYTLCEEADNKVGNKKNSKDDLTSTVRVRRKTMIMFYLTVIFIVTTVMYGMLLSVVAFGILARLEGWRKALYFFFLRLYFINHVINPVFYGIMDPQFRKEMRRLKAKLIQQCQCYSRKT